MKYLPLLLLAAAVAAVIESPGEANGLPGDVGGSAGGADRLPGEAGWSPEAETRDKIPHALRDEIPYGLLSKYQNTFRRVRYQKASITILKSQRYLFFAGKALLASSVADETEENGRRKTLERTSELGCGNQNKDAQGDVTGSPSK
jgi:hypothetical protein